MLMHYSWEMSTIGHPLSDIINLTMPFLTAETGPNAIPGFRPGATPGIPTLQEALKWYAEVKGYDPTPDLDWGSAFGMYRSSVIMQGIAARYAVRQASSEKAKDYADMMVPFGLTAYKNFVKVREAKTESQAKL